MVTFTDLANWAFDHRITLALDVGLTILLLCPLGYFLTVGWARKYDEIDSSLPDHAKYTYLKNYRGYTGPEDKAVVEFKRVYKKWYGRWRFFIPILLVSLIALIENYQLALGLQLWVEEKPITAVSAAIAGGYTFVASDFIARVQRGSLSRADILRGALRMAVSIPVGLAFGQLNKDFAVFIAFGVGIFPLEALTTILRRVLDDKLKLQSDADSVPDRVALLSGIDRPIAERLQDADITTVPQLAWCDPIQLTMRTNLSFEFVSDIVGQSLAWVYLRDKLAVLQAFGLRGAYEIYVLMDELNSRNASEKAKALKALKEAAEAVKMPMDGLRYAFYQIAEDTSTKFIYDSWSE